MAGVALPNRPAPRRAAGAPDVLLAKPAQLYRGWPFSNDFMRHIFKVAAATYPQLAATLPDCRVGFLDGTFERISANEYLRRTAAAPIVAMGVVSPTMALNTEANLRLLKRRNPRVRIALGGHHPTFFAEEWLARGADAVVRGEGERTFPQLVAAWQGDCDLAGVPGISYRENGEIRRNPDALFIENLDELPWPDWSIVNWDIYDLGLRPDGRSAVVETSRGCPHRCAFCCAAEFWRRTQRFKSAGRIVEELARLHALGVRQVAIADDNFGARVTRDSEIFTEIQRRGLDFSFWSFLRADIAWRQPEFLTLAARAGLRFVLVGFESLSDETLGAYGKNLAGAMSAADYAQVYRALKARGIFVYGLFVRHYLQAEGAPRASWRRMRRFSDITAQTRYIAMRGTPAAAELAARGYRLKDAFYHDRLLPTYEEQSSRFALAELFDLLHPANVAKMLFGDYAARRFFRRLYGGLLRDLIRVRWRWLQLARLATDARTPLDERQARFVRLALAACGAGPETQSERP